MRADRLVSIMLLLQSRGKLTAQTLADELSVSRRTILRDVDALSFAGVPIYTDGGHGGGISLDENYRTTLTGLNEREVRALFIAENTQFLSDIGLDEATRGLRRKLSAALPPEQQSVAERVRQRIYIDPSWWWQEEQPLPFWKELETAVFEDRQIRVEYETHHGQVAERILEPYSLVAKASHWYLIARHGADFRMYRATRLRVVQVLDAHFNRDPGFDLVAYWHKHAQEFRQSLAEYTFTLQVHPDRQSFIDSIVPGRYKVVDTDRITGWLTLRFQIESFDLAKMLVFGLGSKATIMDPPDLREAVRKNVQELMTVISTERE